MSFCSLHDPSRLLQDADRCLVFEKDMLWHEFRAERLELPTYAQLPQATFSQTVFLGTWQGEACWAMAMQEEPAEVLSPWQRADLRALVPSLNAEEFQLVSTARHLLWWQSTQQFCGRCGNGLVNAANERARHCAACGHTVYPVIAPAVIVAVKRGDSLLLAHGRNFKGNRHSVIAGFVEAGETLEQAVVREVREEVGIDVMQIRYAASQPWAFPNSLMLGFLAEYAGGEIQVDGHEIDAADWFCENNLPEIPPRGSISRHLIDLSLGIQDSPS